MESQALIDVYPQEKDKCQDKSAWSPTLPLSVALILSATVWGIFGNQNSPNPAHTLSSSEDQGYKAALGYTRPMVLPEGSEVLTVFGRGAHTCSVGSLCSFTVTVADDASWRVTGTKPFEWDLMVSLRGPALVHVHVAQSQARNIPGKAGVWPGRTFLATYRVWDAGEYVVQVTNPCNTLAEPKEGKAGRNSSIKYIFPNIRVVAEWNVSVSKVKGHYQGYAKSDFGATGQSNVVSKLLVPAARASTPGKCRRGYSKNAIYSSDPTYNPCTETLGARWKKEASGVYTWQPFPCARWHPLDDIMPDLYSRGVREIAFVGDSHLRFLMLHAVFLLTGEAPEELLKAHTDFSIDVTTRGSDPMDQRAQEPDPRDQGGRTGMVEKGVEKDWVDARENGRKLVQDSGTPGKTFGLNSSSAIKEEVTEIKWGREGNASDPTIRFSFYWVDGIYRNGEFGCFRRGRWSKREDSFPQLLGKADVAVLDSGTWTALSCKQPALAYPTHLNEFLGNMSRQLKAQNCSKTFFFSAPPSPTCQPGGDYHATNSLLKFQNDFAAIQAAHHGMLFVDTWQVAAPRFEHSCSPQNPHYTCAHLKKGAAHGTLAGDVGEALAITFLQNLWKALQE